MCNNSSQNEKITAIIDLGSNSVRMEIYKIVADGSIHSLLSTKEILSLSSHMDANGFLSSDIIARTLQTLSIFNQIIQDHFNGYEIHAIATEALRKAKNKDILLKHIQEDIGITFRVISGFEEASYAVKATKAALGLDSFILLDTGGGSAEIAVVQDGDLIKSVSLPIGAVILSQRWKLEGMIERKNFTSAVKEVSELYKSIPWIKEFGKLPLVVVGGSNRQIGKISIKRKNLSIKSIRNYKISNEEYFGILDQILETDTETRLLIPGFKAKRVNTIIGGLVPLTALFKSASFSEIIFSDVGVRYGVCLECYEKWKNRNYSIISQNN